jgi:hypothetical protein
MGLQHQMVRLPLCKAKTQIQERQTQPPAQPAPRFGCDESPMSAADQLEGDHELRWTAARVVARALLSLAHA